VVLSLSLGFVGAHRFYLQEPWKGLCYLLFSWTLVPLVLSLVDAAWLARMTCSDFHEAYGAKNAEPTFGRLRV
jgi:TM2 domain-containing membrane protein YozV